MNKFPISARAAFIIGIVQAIVSAILGLQAAGTTGIVVTAGSYMSLGILVITVLQAATNYLTTNTSVIPSDGPII